MIKITSDPISPEPLISKLRNDDYGAIVTFIGTVRKATKGREVAFLEIETQDENAEANLSKIATGVSETWNLQDIVIYRRIGRLKVGEIALVIAIAAPHRQEAFQACQYAVDRIKQGEITTEKEIYEAGEGYAEG